MGNFVLEAQDERTYQYKDGYYTGKSYVYQGERYADVNKDIDVAKKYTSRKRAERACTIPFANYRFIVKEV